MWCGVDVTGTCQTSGVRHVSLFAGSAPLSCFLAISTHSGSRGSPRCSLVVFPSSPLRRAVLVETQDRCRVHAEPLLGPRWPRWRVWASDLWNRDLHSRREAICAPKIVVFGGAKGHATRMRKLSVNKKHGYWNGGLLQQVVVSALSGAVEEDRGEQAQGQRET